MKKILLFAAMALLADSCNLRVHFDEPTGDCIGAAEVRTTMMEQDYDAAVLTTVGDTQRAVYHRFGYDTLDYTGCCQSATHYYAEHGNAVISLDIDSVVFTFQRTDSNTVQLRLPGVPRRLVNLQMTGISMTDTTVEYDLRLYGAVYSHNLLMLRQPISNPLDDRRVQNLIAHTALHLQTDGCGFTHCTDTVADEEESMAAILDSMTCHGLFERMEAAAREEGFTNFGIEYRGSGQVSTISCIGGKMKVDRCQERMERLSSVAAAEGLTGWSIHHKGTRIPNLHDGCTFTMEAIIE